jgi:hypothetical protein
MLEEALTDLEALLSEERDAIVRLEGARVLDLAARKQELVGRLAAHRGAFTSRTAARLRALTPALRHNGILLAHARDVLRDAVAAARAGGASLIPPAAVPVKTERRTLSVRG